jgi:hypothetical protein
MEYLSAFFKHLKSQSFFLLGPRGTGKSTWLRSEFSSSLYLDLLSEGLFQELLRNPESLRQRILGLEAPVSKEDHFGRLAGPPRTAIGDL